MNTDADRIERQIVLKASRSRVWRAISTAEEFGSWFGIAFRNTVFAAGKHIQGNIAHPGYEHLLFNAWIERMEPERLMSWRWHPYAVDTTIDYSQEPRTLVVFELKEVAEGTLLTVVESGFENIPLSRRQEAFRMNSGGWTEQMVNIEKHVAKP